MNITPPVSVAYLPTSRDFKEEQEQLDLVLSKSYTETALAVNKRTIGTYNTFQAVTGNQYYSAQNNNVANPIQFRQSYRQTFPFGAIAQGATLTITHGITGITELVNFYGNCITDQTVIATAKYKPIPFVSTTAANQQVSLYVNDTIISIVNGTGADNILSGTIVIEYLLN